MLSEIRNRVRVSILENEQAALVRLIAQADLSESVREKIADHAAKLIQRVRDESDPNVMEAFLDEFGLSTKEGVALMCLAEALLRVPDDETIDDLIRDKIVPHDWGAHVGDSGSLLVNASTWALMLTGRVMDEGAREGVVDTLRGALRRLSEPVIRTAVGRAMREMGRQFVLGRDIDEAMQRGEAMVERSYTYSFDMLGEAVLTEADAARYHTAYARAIAAIGVQSKSADMRENPGISVKLSALHPRYEYPQHETMLPQMIERVLELARSARDAQIGFNIDAEEADRLDLSLDVIEGVLSDPSLAGWDGFGVVVQAYGPRCSAVLDWLYALAEHHDRKIMVRLVKGAYWDSEVKHAQELGLDGFPVFTHKANTDVSYISNARKLLSMRGRLYPQFATHNAHTVAAILEMAGDDRASFEFQRLHGMGEALHEVVRKTEGTRCRIYAPVGPHRDLLAYLVRRLLENGANSSFVNQIVDETISPEEIASDPFKVCDGVLNPAIAHPSSIFGSRRNSAGWDLTDPLNITEIEAGRKPFGAGAKWTAGQGGQNVRPIPNPCDPDDLVGTVQEATRDDAQKEIGRAVAAAAVWAKTPVQDRADILRRIADLYEEHAHEFFALTAREAGKTLLDAVGEVREAVDFLRYYAGQAQRAEQGAAPRGCIVCISPWNFPLAIFTGQISAALVTGNTVIAKPAEQTPLVASRAIELMHEAGVPQDVLRLVCGAGDVGAALSGDPRIAGVCFTGSTEVATIINRQLAETAPDAMLIAETGGLNAMIVDSTALPEQAVSDILASAFQSAGQRCSALRILYVQRDIEDDVLTMLFGAMDLLRVGAPWEISTDVGPVIDDGAHADISAYIDEAKRSGRVLKQAAAPSGGNFVPPTVIRVNGIEDMPREIFGPVLHIASFEGEDITDVIDAVNTRGYGLTFGLHTRIDRRVQDVVDTVAVGNFYVNRNQIGAVVGSQPFGGQGLSGTGPKAGGPHYLPQFRQRLEVSSAPTVDSDRTLSIEEVEAAFAKMDALAWAQRTDRVPALRQVLRGRAADAMTAAASLDMGPLDLPGPTGESNRLNMVPLGRVLCLGPGEDAALDQAVQALRCGNAVVAFGIERSDVFAELIEAGFPVATLDGSPSLEALEHARFDAVAEAGGDIEIRKALARREGAIMPCIRQRLSPAAYAHERALCINTTAAGGNVSLLANAG